MIDLSPSATAAAARPSSHDLRSSPATADKCSSELVSELAHDPRFDYVLRCLIAKVLRSWLVSPAVVCWLEWFGHPLTEDPSDGGAADACKSFAMHAKPRVGDENCDAPEAIDDHASPAADVEGSRDADSVCSSWSRSSSTRTSVQRDDRADASLITSHIVGSSEKADTTPDVEHLVLCGATCRPLGEDTPFWAAVSREAFECFVMRDIKGLMPVLALAFEHRAYVMKYSNYKFPVGIDPENQGDGPATATLGAPPDTVYPLGGCHDAVGTASSEAVQDVVCAATAADTSSRCDPASVGSAGCHDDPPVHCLRDRSDANWVVPLTLFDRFVRICAEPSAQAAWRVNARLAVRTAAEAALKEARVSGMCQRSLDELIVSGRFAADVAFASGAALLPLSTAVVRSAFSAYGHGKCPGAWADFLPRQQVEEKLRAQAVREGGPGAFLMCSHGARPCVVLLSYTAHSDSRDRGNGISVIHEILELSPGGSVILPGIEYPALAQAVCANRAFLKSPCSAESADWAPPAGPTNTTPAAQAGVETCGPFPSALSSSSGLLESAAEEAHALGRFMQHGAGAPLFTHVGTGLPILVYALYGRDLSRLPSTRAVT